MDDDGEQNDTIVLKIPAFVLELTAVNKFPLCTEMINVKEVKFYVRFYMCLKCFRYPSQNHLSLNNSVFFSTVYIVLYTYL